MLGKESKVISSLMFVSMALLAVALLTINSSFAVTALNDPSNWKVFFSDAEIRSKTNGDVEIISDIINFDVVLKDFNEEFSFVTTINNDGTYNAYLEKMIISPLTDTVVGTSKTTGYTYTASDYINLQVINYEDNIANEIKANTEVKKGDLLNMGTENKILISVKYRDESSLTNDQLEVLNEYGKVFKLNLSINALYQQNK